MKDTIGMTDIGNGRPSNQDAYLLRQKEKNGKLYLLAVVCDGMGGLKKGEIASHYIVEVLKQWFDETLFDGLETMGIDMIEQNLIDLIRRINQNLLLMSRRMEETKSMGSTLTLLFVEEHEFFVLNVGNDRSHSGRVGTACWTSHKRTGKKRSEKTYSDPVCRCDKRYPD